MEETNTNQQNEEKTYEYTQMNMFEQEGNKQSSSDNNENENQQKDNFSNINTKADAEKLLEGAGISYKDLQKEYNETGAISDESREKLLKSGIAGEFIDNYIKGQKAVLDVELNEISQCIGGRENLSSILEWAGKNLAQDEKISINAVRDKNLLKIILKDLKLRMEEKEGIMPKYTKGSNAKVSQNVFRSKAEMYDAISNPRYKRDEAYRADVQRAIAASMRAGIDLGI